MSKLRRISSYLPDLAVGHLISKCLNKEAKNHLLFIPTVALPYSSGLNEDLHFLPEYYKQQKKLPLSVYCSAKRQWKSCSLRRHWKSIQPFMQLVSQEYGVFLQQKYTFLNCTVLRAPNSVIMLSVSMLSVIMLSVFILIVITMGVIMQCHYFECYYDECNYADCHYVECPYAECPYADGHYADCHYAYCHYADCHYAECHYADCHYDRCHYAVSLFWVSLHWVPLCCVCRYAEYRGAHTCLTLWEMFTRPSCNVGFIHDKLVSVRNWTCPLKNRAILNLL